MVTQLSSIFVSGVGLAQVEETERDGMLAEAREIISNQCGGG